MTRNNFTCRCVSRRTTLEGGGGEESKNVSVQVKCDAASGHFLQHQEDLHCRAIDDPLFRSNSYKDCSDLTRRRETFSS